MKVIDEQWLLNKAATIAKKRDRMHKLKNDKAALQFDHQYLLIMEVLGQCKPILTEWWFKDALGKMEMKCVKQFGVTQELVDFYEGRLYQKEVDSPTPHNHWILIK